MRRLLNFLIAAATIYCLFLLITINFKKVQIGSFANFGVVDTNQFFLILAFNIAFFLIYLYGYRYVKAWLVVHRKPQTMLFALQLAGLIILGTQAYLLTSLKILSQDDLIETIKV